MYPDIRLWSNFLFRLQWHVGVVVPMWKNFYHPSLYMSRIIWKIILETRFPLYECETFSSTIHTYLWYLEHVHYRMASGLWVMILEQLTLACLYKEVSASHLNMPI